jgi:hypothetical protein
MSLQGRPKGGYHSAQREGTPMTAAGPPQGANSAPSGGSAAAELANEATSVGGSP